MNYTRHAKARAQQRCIPPLVVDWLLVYGRRSPAQEAERVSFDKRARRELARDVGLPVVKQMARFLNASIVVDAQTEKVITVMWTH